jgi:hypothetical protein
LTAQGSSGGLCSAGVAFFLPSQRGDVRFILLSYRCIDPVPVRIAPRDQAIFDANVKLSDALTVKVLYRPQTISMIKYLHTDTSSLFVRDRLAPVSPV